MAFAEVGFVLDELFPGRIFFEVRFGFFDVGEGLEVFDGCCLGAFESGEILFVVVVWVDFGEFIFHE